MKHVRISFYLLCLLMGLFFIVFIPASAESNGTGQTVYVIPIENEVEKGLESFLRRTITEAEESGAAHIIFEVDTPGGFVNAADDIARIVRTTDVPTTAYVVGQAMSAGAYISLNADQIIMAPGSKMGAAAVIDGSGNAAEDKANSAWLASMREAAELNDRDPIFALAMADKRIDLPDYGAPEGELLSLTSRWALEVEYAEAIAADRSEVLDFLDLQNASIIEMEVSFAERLARIITSPVVIPILLSLGSLGLILELYSPGFGVPGIMGASSLFLFFFGHYVAGFAGWEVLLLFLAGIILIAIEIFAPTSGILGLIGVGAIIASIIMSSYSVTIILASLIIAFVVTLIASVLFFKYFGTYRGPFKKFILTESLTAEQGYLSNSSRDDLIGDLGESVTRLNPSGTVLVNEERLDGISEGGYIEGGRKVKIVSVQGTRVVVREM